MSASIPAAAARAPGPPCPGANLGRRLRRIHLRLSLTGRCDLRCRYCRPAREARPREATAPASDAELLELVETIGRAYPIYKLRLTGGEPLLRPDLPDLVARLRERLPGAELGLTTNGTRLARHAAALREAGIASLNVSLDTLDAGVAHALTRGGRLSRVLAGLDAAAAAGFPRLKLNAVLLRRQNGGALADLVRFAAARACEIRFIELMPFGEGAHLHAAEYLSAPEALARLRRRFAYLGRADDSATARRHRLRVDGRETVVGFIPALSDPFCATCDRIRLDHRGRLRDCLRAEGAADLLGPLRAGRPEEALARVRAAVAGKAVPAPVWPRHPMVEIGG